MHWPRKYHPGKVSPWHAGYLGSPVDGATTGQKVVDCYCAAGFETIGTISVDKTGGDWEETVAKLVTHGGVEDGAALRTWAENVAPDSIICVRNCKRSAFILTSSDFLLCMY